MFNESFLPLDSCTFFTVMSIIYPSACNYTLHIFYLISPSCKLFFAISAFVHIFNQSRFLVHDLVNATFAMTNSFALKQ